MLGPLKYVRARTLAGKLTNFKTGDRFVDIVLRDEPLPKKMMFFFFTAALYQQELVFEKTLCPQHLFVPRYGRI